MLILADITSNTLNMVAICKKYYLDVVIKELCLNNTYKEVHKNIVNLIFRHLNYMAKNGIDVQEHYK